MRSHFQLVRRHSAPDPYAPSERQVEQVFAGKKRQIYIIAPNRLAGEYLADILSHDLTLEPVLYRGLPVTESSANPSLFVFDNSLQLLPITECLARLRSKFRDAKYLVLDGPRAEDEIVQLLALGVHGFIEHSQVFGVLRQAVQTILSGQLWVSNSALQAYATLRCGFAKGRVDTLSATTRREAEVLELIRRRLTNKEIAELLKVTESTVKYHVSNILGKLNATNRHDLEERSGLPFRELLKEFY